MSTTAAAVQKEHGDTQNASGTQEAAAAGTRKLNIDLLKIIHAARQTYGLRTNDYARYHAHAARRVATLHRATKTLNKPSSKKTSAAAAAGKGKKTGNASKAAYISTTSQITPDAVLKDERLLELLVWETERAWSEGMKQREEIASLERSNSQQALAPKRHRAVKRFQRASQYAETLSNIAVSLYKTANAPLTATAAFQIEIYHHYMDGTLGFVRSTSPGASSSPVPSSSDALSSLGNAYVLLESFSQSTARATEEAIALELLDELEPLVRYCAYKSGSTDSRSPPEIARDAGREAVSRLQDDGHYPDLLAKLGKESAGHKSKTKQTVAVNHLNWRDVDVPIRSAELAEILGRVNAAIEGARTKQTSKIPKTKPKTTSIAVYDRSLATLIEAEDKARKLVDDNTVALARAHSARFEAAAKPLSLVHSYILFHLLSIRLQRDETLLQATLVRLTRREDKFHDEASAFGSVSMRVKRRRMKLYPVLVKLLDGMSQSLERMRSLLVVEEDSTDLAEETDALSAYTRARRCLYLGETYAMLDKYPEALSLLQRGNLYLRQAQSLLTTVGTPIPSVQPVSTGLPHPVESLEKLPALQKALENAETRAGKDWYLYSLLPKDHTDESTSASPSLDRSLKAMALQGADSGRKKGRKPGPLFFDIAFSYIAPVGVDTLPEDSALNLPVGDDRATATAAPGQAAEDSHAHVNQVVTEPPQVETQNSSRGLWGLFGRRK